MKAICPNAQHVQHAATLRSILLHMLCGEVLAAVSMNCPAQQSSRWGTGLVQMQSIQRVPSVLVTEEQTLRSFFSAVLCSACLGGCLHGVAMAMKKQYGQGHPQYWLQWRWWIGVTCDALAGALIWPAFPVVPVQVLMPSVLVVQLGTSYVLGLAVFNEESDSYSNAGLMFAIIGVIGLSQSTSHKTAVFNLAEFWPALVALRFLVANVVAIFIISSSFLFFHRSTCYALTGAFFEAVQYVCSRTIASAMYADVWHFLMTGEVMTALVIKGCCILLIIHLQQMGLESDLSRFVPIYLMSCMLFQCTYGASFFGDTAHLTLAFMASASSTMIGIVFLNHQGSERNNEDKPKDGTIA